MPNSERPNKVIMGLGIATVVLLSANLIAVLAQRVWPKLQDMALIQSQTQAEEVDAESETATIHIQSLPHRQHTFVHVSPMIQKRHRCSRTHIETDLDTQLDIDLNRLEREIERETSRLERDLSAVDKELEEAISLRLLMNGNKTLVLNRKANLAKMEEQMRKITREFEIRVQEHETAAEKARIIVKEHEH